MIVENKSIMKKFIPYLLFSATTLHTLLDVSPVMAMSCSSHSDEIEAVCKDDGTDCQNKIPRSSPN